MDATYIFLGVPVSPAQEALLDKKWVSLLGSYLDRVEHLNTTYWGKKIVGSCQLEDLELLQVHIISLLHKLHWEAPPPCSLLALTSPSYATIC